MPVFEHTAACRKRLALLPAIMGFFVAGLDATHEKLTLMLLDGRKPGIAAGMTYEELAAEMLRLGCTEAINLDGGGSSVMAYRKDGKMCILNEPTDGRERAVADVLGITVEK